MSKEHLIFTFRETKWLPENGRDARLKSDLEILKYIHIFTNILGRDLKFGIYTQIKVYYFRKTKILKNEQYLFIFYQKNYLFHVLSDTKNQQCLE